SDDAPRAALDDDDHDGDVDDDAGDPDDDDGARRVVRSRRRPSAPYEVDGDGDASSDDGGDAPKRKRSRSRRTSREDDAGTGEAPTRKKRASRKKASASDAEDSPDGDEAPVRKRKASKKSTARRSKKKASRADGDDGSDAEAPEKPAKKSSRKKKADSKEKTRKEPAKKAGEKSRKKASKKKASSRSPKGSAGKGQKKRGARTGRRGGRGDRRPQREQRPIDELLKVGDSVVVQVTKDAIGDKGPTLTTYVSMPGRYLVLMPSMARTGVSRKIPDDKERKRLKRILASVDTPKDMGVIVRTAGVGRTKTDLKRDLDYLMGLWDSFGKKLKSSRGPSPLYLESDVATRTLRDLFNRETKEVVVDDFTVYEQMVNFAEALMPEHVGRIKRYEGGKPLFQHHGIEPDFERIFARRVDLPSGGSIVFDQA
ncbi:MAG: ribonuclease E/G, partial [Planctomycetota bacterium]